MCVAIAAVYTSIVVRLLELLDRQLHDYHDQASRFSTVMSVSGAVAIGVTYFLVIAPMLTSRSGTSVFTSKLCFVNLGCIRDKICEIRY